MRGRSARLIYAGKQGGDHTLSQGEINALLVAEAGKGAIVARLKGGDPFIFGRGGEEAEVLREAGIPFRNRSRHQFGDCRSRLCGDPSDPPESYRIGGLCHGA